MLCKDAISGKIVSVKEDTSVEDALKALKTSGQDAILVTDADGVPVGFFSISVLLVNLLPVSIPMTGGLQLDVTINAAPGVARRLKNIAMVRVGDVMERKVQAVAGDVPLWEGIQMLLIHKAPVLVADSRTRTPLGFMSLESAFDELNRAKDNA